MTKTNDLVRALVGDRHTGLYVDNIEFKMAIDQLARLLPSMINGLADTCQDSQRMRAESLEQVMSAVPRVTIAETDLSGSVDHDLS